MYLLRIAARVVAICLTLCFLSILPQAVGAANPPADMPGEAVIDQAADNSGAVTGTVKGGEHTAVGLEEAVGIAKEAFPVPPGLDQFSTGFDQSDGNAFWTLRWYRSGDPGGEMNVRVNAATGEIWGMHIWMPPAPGQGYRGLPEYTRGQIESVAKALAEKLQPERFKETRLQPERSDYLYMPPLYREREQMLYSYFYARTVNGVTYPENGITVTVSGDTGAVTGFDLRWEDAGNFPPASGRITQAQAVQVFRTECGPQLYYFRSSVPGGKEVPLKLVYRLPGPQNQVIIDALTGKPLNKNGDFYMLYDMAGGGGGESLRMKMPSSADQKIEFTPVEESAVREAKTLLSRDKALQAAKSFVKVPENYNLTGSRLMQDYLFQDKKTWSFNWQAGDGTDRKWMEVSVDASTGELVSFCKDRYRGYDYLKAPEIKFSEEDARKTAEEFIKKLQPGKWQQVVFESARPEWGPVTGPAEKPLPRSYNFNWVRTAKEIEFPQNGFNLNVDSTTGEINHYQMNWWEVEFPDPQGVIGTEAAADKYLRENPLTVAYLRLWSQDGWVGPEESKVYLVYYMAQRNFAMLDAFTGQLLDYEGNEIEATGKKGQFTDIADHPAREAVETLASHGIVTGGDGKFRPDNAVTQAELITMLVRSKGRFLDTISPVRSLDGKEPWYQRYFDEAARMGIIRAGEKPDPDAPVTREALAGLTINTMGLYQAACLKDIYILNFQDAGEISEHLRGHAALSAGMGLIEPVDGKFEPGQVVGRANAAEIIVKLLKMAD